MDDLKIYAASKSYLRLAVGVVQRYSNDIGMFFGLVKCAVTHLLKGRLQGLVQEMELIDGSIIRALRAGESYQYLGFDQNQAQDTVKIEMALCSEYKRRLRRLWSSELSGKNKVEATNMLAVPVLTYSFGVVKWNWNELQDLDRETRKRMHMERSLHPRSSVARIYLPRHEGGRGLLGLENLHNRVALQFVCSIQRCSDPLMQLVHDHEVAGVGAFLYKAAQHAADTLGLDFRTDREEEHEPNQLRARIKTAESRLLLQQHKDKSLHGVFYRHVEEQGLSKPLTFAFLKSAALKSETEGFILACQDGVINTLSYRSRVMHMDVPDISYRVCHRAPETIMHILSSCSVHATAGCIHNAALRVLYYHLRHLYAPAEGNIVTKEEEKQTKYHDLLMELRRLNPGYSVRMVVLIVGVLGGMRPSFLANLRTIPACERPAAVLTGQMQKAVILGSLRLLRANDLMVTDPV
ncbi:uncharacterized protein LOC120352632 [Nilaparvata lugens]|uniref:uncharacterized protein LOC120352632 n=1 Tax=Nilaparvata lugens TaxID=108931 RepID=UPI00193CC956|nr:uncharacterized protein LOC120352632 [Nilaparvata lugens]